VEPVPTTIGRYVVEGLVGIGAMGRIYKAHDPDIRRTVAIKLISTNLMSRADSDNYIRRFRREAEAAARCVHPNIVTVYDFALHEGEPFLVMEFVKGISLRQALDEQPIIAVGDAIAVMLQVLDALHSAHGKGVIHRDIKPANIMLTPEKTVKVGDFGISRLANAAVTTVFDTVGTPAYMSPEQCRGDELDGRSDLFSAGATLFEMVSGNKAFPGRNEIEVSRRIQNERLPILPSKVRAAAPELQSVLERSTAKRADGRFDSGVQMADALRRVQVDLSDGEQRDDTRVYPRPSVVHSSDAPSAAARDPLLGPQTNWTPDLNSLRLLERKLTDFVGPIARILVLKAIDRSKSTKELLSELALRIPDAIERERFRREADLMLRRPPQEAVHSGQLDKSGGSGSKLTESEIERVQAMLAQFVGPIARVLVRRAANNVSSVEALWQTLAVHIDSPGERAAFLRQRQI